MFRVVNNCNRRLTKLGGIRKGLLLPSFNSNSLEWNKVSYQSSIGESIVTRRWESVGVTKVEEVDIEEEEDTRTDQVKLKTFESLGIDSRICQKLETEFGIKYATPAQTLLLESWQKGREVILNDTTGSGKTFALTVQLLHQTLTSTSSSIRALLIVPNRELALQVYSWCQRLLPSEEPTTLSHFQVAYRDQELNPKHDTQLQTHPPSFLIATPTRLLDLVERRTLNLNEVESVVLDEVDHLLRLPSKYAPRVRVRNREAHPKPTNTILDSLFRSQTPQLAVMSATLNHRLRFYLRQKGWMSRPVYIDGAQGHHAQPPVTLEHMCVVVASDSVYNLPLPPKSSSPLQVTELPTSPLNSELSEEAFLEADRRMENPISEQDFQDSDVGEGEREREFEDRLEENDERLIECVGVAAHADEVELGLLFIPNWVTVKPVLAILRKLGIDAQAMSDYFPSSPSPTPTPSSDDTPRLLVATYFNARGLDIPTATHVYLVGFPTSPRDYLHIAGRAGRLSGTSFPSSSPSDHPPTSLPHPQPGRVVTFLPSGAHRPARMRQLYQYLAVQPLPYPHITS